MTSTYSSDTNTIQPCRNIASSEVKLIIHHQFPGIELVSPIYACCYATCYSSPDQRVDVGFTTQANFKTAFHWREPLGILMYELKNTKQPNKNAISSKEKSRYIQLPIIWKVNNSNEFFVVSGLMEYDKEYVWNRDNLMKLAKWYGLFNIRHVPIENTYLMRDNTVLMTRVNVTHEGDCYKLEMTISKTSIKYNTWRLEYIDVDR
jgi:hypothetical protein